MRQHLLAAWKATGERPPQLDTPQAPLGQRHLLAWFYDMACARQMGYSEPCSLSWVEMRAWAELQGLMLEPWQVQILRRLDQMWLAAWRAGQERRNAATSD